LPDPAVRPFLFHFLPLVAVKAKVVVCGIDFCLADQAEHN
jgi:hypothetical protein